MNIWGVYKVEQVGDIDYVEADTLIVCFEKEQDALDYQALHNRPRMVDGEVYDKLFVRPVTFIAAGEYDHTNNYGLAADEHLGASFICDCGHATVVPYEKLETQKEEIKENNVVVGLRITLPFVCERCHQNQLAAEEILMFNSEDENIRCQVANMGYNLENYIYDSSSRVRQIVARKGLGHDVFIANPDEPPAVLREIAGQGKYLDVLKDHPDKSVSKLANKKLRQMSK